jgi:cytochrome c biogenesis protein CcmG/thiol:disulfide interchange protein DsbE
MHPSTLVACLLVVGFLSGCSSPRSAPAAATRKNAPEFALPGRHGDLVHLVDYRGQVLILDFWATWCGPCRIEIPWFNELAEKYNASGLAVLGVSLDEKGWQAVDPFARELKVAYPIVLGNDRIARQYGVGPPPTTFVIDREGKIAAGFAGLVNRKAFEHEIQRLLQLPDQDARTSK